MSTLFALASSTAPSVGGFVGTPERIWASLAALVALVGVVIGCWALSRARRSNGGRKWPIIALLAGMTGVINGALNLTVADGGPGTGNGVIGGAVALALGLVGAVLGWLAIGCSRRAEPDTTSAAGDHARLS